MSNEKKVSPYVDIAPFADQQANAASIRRMAEVALMTQEELAALKIIYPGMQQRDILKSFRELRTHLMQKSGGNNFVMLVTSINVDGGSSFTAINAAASFALDEEKTAVYVDCNFENSFANKLLKNNVDYGLIDYIDDPSLDLKDVIYAAGIPRVRVIPPGRGGETAMEKLASPRMQKLIDDLKSRYPDRFIVLDVPPVAESSLARILSHAADMAVLVVPFGKVTPTQVMSGIDAVGEEKFAGLVFNHI